jgi:membrane fusion protein (multidrug efflux system)
LRNISVGALIEPGDLITTLDDDSVMKLDFSVPSIHLESLAPNCPSKRSPAFAGRKFEGTVASIGSRIDPVTRAIVVRAILPNPERLLKPGLLMRVELAEKSADSFGDSRRGADSRPAATIMCWWWTVPPHPQSPSAAR